MRLSRLLYSILLFISATAFAADGPVVSADRVARLNDAPAARFDTSGWDYADTTNPFILTPDKLTNAMIGVSRLSRGQRLLDGKASVPQELGIGEIRAALARRLKGREALSIAVETIGLRQVVVARYREGARQATEYAFEFRQHLAHVLLVALPGAYFERGTRVAQRIVASFASP